MALFEATSATQAYRDLCEDRVACFADEQRIVVAVADGAGGTGNGLLAANTAILQVEQAYRDVQSPNDWAELLRQIDQRIADGQTTLVVVDIRSYGIGGASVGDSRAVSINDEIVMDLTQNQQRKPLLGSGDANPIAFQTTALGGVLLVGTDGFFNYAKHDDIVRLVNCQPFDTLTRKCIELVRLPSGEYWDDIGIVAVRSKPKITTRRRYALD